MPANKLNNRLLRIYINGETSERKNFIWNMVGSMIFSAASMILSLLIIKIVGENDGGVFAIAITVAQMLAFIEYYETRTFQVTDIQKIYKFGHYKATKQVLLLVSLVVSLFYSMIKSKMNIYKCVVIFLMCIYRLIDAYADLYEGAFQKDGRLDLTGKSQAFRTILSVTALLLSLLITGNMILSIVVAITFALVGLFIFDTLPMKMFRSTKINWDRKYIEGILKSCFPLFIGSFLWSYILSASRIAVDAKMASNYSAYFQTLFMPVSIVNLFATFVMKPALTKLTDEYFGINKKHFVASIMKIVIMIIIFTIVCVMGAWVLGIPILQFLTGTKLMQYRIILILLMFAGGINALAYFGYYVLTIMRKSYCIIGGYMVSAIVAKIVNDLLVVEFGIGGAAVGFLISVLVLLIIFYIGILGGLLNQTNLRKN